LDVLVAKRVLEAKVIEKGKDLLAEIVAMLVGLIRANSESRVV
jgi:hypothetical protein